MSAVLRRLCGGRLFICGRRLRDRRVILRPNDTPGHRATDQRRAPDSDRTQAAPRNRARLHIRCWFIMVTFFIRILPCFNLSTRNRIRADIMLNSALFYVASPIGAAKVL